jgi:hypothetical protein
LQYASRGYFALGLTKPSAPPTTKPGKSRGVQTSSGGGGSHPAPPVPLPLPPEAYGYTTGTPPPVYASAAHPSRYAVLAIAGKTPSQVRDYTANALIVALGKRGQTAALADPDASQHPLLRGKEICDQTGAAVLVWGNVATVSNDASQGEPLWTNAVLNIYAFDCAGSGFQGAKKPVVGAAGPWKTAIDHAADEAVSAYLLSIARKTKAS